MTARSPRSRAQQLHRRVALATVVVPAAATVAAIALWSHAGRPPRSVLALTAVFYLLSALGVTVGFHRLFTHRAFAAPTPVRWLLAGLGSLSAQGPLVSWIAAHRRHHQRSDRDGDPHSPVVGGFWHAHLGWMMTSAPDDIGRYALDALRDRVALRASLGYPAFVAFGIALPAVLAGAWEGTWSAAGLGALWAGGVRMCGLHHVTWSVNSVCHLWGRRPFETRDHSRNHAVVALLSLGEGWHNNHHAFPWSARHGLGRWQIDVSWWAIRGLAWAGLASRVRLPAVEVGR